MVLELGKSQAEVARDLEIGESVLGRWVRKARGLDDPATSAAATDVTRLQAENERLRKENEFLKKAAAFFAKESQ